MSTTSNLNGNYQYPTSLANNTTATKESGTQSQNAKSTENETKTNNTTQTENKTSNPLGDKPIPNKNQEDSNSLSNEAFMRLFLEQLKNQDPTSPMETQEILTQTAQLTQVEAQEKMKKAMEDMTTTMKSMQETNQSTIEAQKKLVETQQKMLETMGTLSNSIKDSSILDGYNTVGMIGNIAETAFTALKVEKNEPINFELYFDEPIDPTKGSPKVTITDKDNKVVREIDLAEKNPDGTYKYQGKQGYVAFEWDTRNNKGEFMGKGEYTVKAEYNLDANTNKYKGTQLGRGEVQSILFEQGVPYVKLGDNLTVPIIYVTSYHKK